jgi:hypothetical protein
MIDVILDGASCEMSRGVGQSTAGALQVHPLSSTSLEFTDNIHVASIFAARSKSEL